jgi:DNA polymerase-1
MSIPLMDNSGPYWTEAQEVTIWQLLAEVLESPSVGKIMQNGMFDSMFLLRTLGIKTTNFLFDTMLAQHLCWADLSKGLDRIVATYTYHPYYKDEGKQTHLKLIKDWPTHWNYNAKDALLTHQAKEPLVRELQKLGIEDYYFSYLMKLHKPLMEMEYRGILTDSEGIKTRAAFMSKAIRVLQNSLDRIAGQHLNVNSSKQMISYFYGTLGLKPYLNRKTKNPTCDDMALTRIARKKSKGSREAKIIQKIRELSKLLSTYFEVETDSDNRLRCQYEISGTNTGRLSSRSTFFGTGTNLQNQPPAFKRYLVPDPGYILAEIDLARAEAHVVAYCCEDSNMIHAFESGVDVHTYNAAQIFDVPMEEVTKAQRNMGKRTVHAKNYGMGYVTFSLAAEIPQKRAAALLEAYDERFPGLLRWQGEIREHVFRKRILWNLFGRPKRFLGNLASHSKDIYSYIPQSTVGEVLNRGLIQIAEDSELYSRWDFQLLAQVHDSVLFQFWDFGTPEEAFALLDRVQNHLAIPLTTKGRTFTIGRDGKISKKSWGNMQKVEPITLENVQKAYMSL